MTSAAIAGRSTVHLKVLSAGAVKYVLTDFAPRFTRDTGDQIEFTFGTIGGVRERLREGETADIIMGTAPAISQMEQSGVIAAGSRADLGRTLTGICVRADTPMPDISTPDGFKQTLLKARSVAYTNPQAGGTSGIFLVGLLERLGIAEAVAGPALHQWRRGRRQGFRGRRRDRLDLPQRDRADEGGQGGRGAAAADAKRHRLCRRDHDGEQQPRGRRAVHRHADRTRATQGLAVAGIRARRLRLIAATSRPHWRRSPRRRGAQTSDDAHTRLDRRPSSRHNDNNKTMGEDPQWKDFALP